MSKLDNLLEELCPFGVEYTELIENVEIINGFSFKSNEYSNEGLRVIRISDVQKGVISDKDIKYYPVKYESELSQFILRDGDLLMSLTGNVGRVAMLSSIHLPAALNQRVACLRPKSGRILARFLFHFLNQDKFEQVAIQNSTGGGQKNLSTTWLAKFKIPIPPLEVQQEIVRILDNFTELTAELTAELKARKAQNRYYKAKLLSFNQVVPRYKLDEIVHFRNGKGHEKEISVDGKYVVVNSRFISTDGQVQKYSHNQLCPLFENDILMVMSDLPNGRALAKCYVVEKNDKYTLNQRIGAFSSRDERIIQTRYLYYILDRNSQLLRFDNGVDQTNLKKDDILNILIPVPTIEEQSRIVSILDRFDTLVNDIKQGLPAEIAARQKQYEYYRDKLLTFKEVGDESI